MKTLRSLLEAAGLFVKGVPHSITIDTICQHSSRCNGNSVFFAFKGTHTNGSLYITEAIQNGAVCIISEQRIDKQLLGQVFCFTVENAHSVFARMCSAYYDHPQNHLTIIGVSGTDGKSTTCDYTYQLLKMQNIHAGVLTTVSIDDGQGKRDSPFRQSTPEPDALFCFLHTCVKSKVTHVVLECTSHGLSKKFDRLAGIFYDCAIITKVTSEHLEFHHSLEEYIQAKLNLVRFLKKDGIFITSTDNAKLTLFENALAQDSRSIILGRDVDMRIEFMGYQGVVVEILKKRFHLPLLLPSLATNALLSAYCVSDLLGINVIDTISKIEQLKPVKGRMQLIENTLGLRIIIDFAHTADAYEGVFFFAKRTSEGGDIIAVFGSAGERDTAKRSKMGKIANRYSQVIILTEEDPRGEGNRTIFNDLKHEMINPRCKVLEIEDRKAAIEKALHIAQSGDTLLFLGKGHERSIERGKETIPWDEIETIKKAVEIQQGIRI